MLRQYLHLSQMKNILKRIRAIWRLSGMEIVMTDRKVELKDLLDVTDSLPTPPKMAQVIKRSTPAQEFLKNEQSR